MTCNHLDPNDPRVWFRMLVDAVVGVQAKRTEPALVYLRFVEQHRGKAVASEAWKRIKELAGCDAWADAARWPGWGYHHKPPKEAINHGPARKGSTRR